jgi:hypothetical protein
MKFSWEVPIYHLEDFDKDQDFLFALSFLCSDKRYTNYMKKKRSNRKLILDNSYNEINKPENPINLHNISKILNPDFVVCPDDDTWTIKELKEVYKKMTELFPNDSLLLVVKSLPEVLFASKEKVEYCTTYTQRNILSDKANYDAYHFLGIRSLKELEKFSPKSCDSGMPIKLALMDITIPEWELKGCKHIKTNQDYFKTKMTTKQIDLAKRNIAYIKERLGNV